MKRDSPGRGGQSTEKAQGSVLEDGDTSPARGGHAGPGDLLHAWWDDCIQEVVSGEQQPEAIDWRPSLVSVPHSSALRSLI